MQFLAQFDMGILEKHQLRLSKGKDEEDYDFGGGLLLEHAKPKIKKPSLYKVMMMNDDYTPMEFVVHVLQAFFVMDREKATRVMLQVHTDGKAVCGIYIKDIAETKAAQAIEYAQQNEHPLICEIEAVEEDDS
ncbi:MAG: ATP-dependent Clp protease adaptor protein ClpS [Cellvibrionaceae bacterium]|jgi:ATP-dependent Clp protease adaptor protein ClpS